MSAARERLPLSSFETRWKSPAFLPDPTLPFPEVFARRLIECPGDVAFTIVVGKGREHAERPVTYEALRELIEVAASHLTALSVSRQDRVILSLERPDEFFSYLMACQALGLIPVPVPPASDYQMPTAFRDRIRAVVGDCAPKIIVADSLASWAGAASDVAPDVPVIEGGSIHGPRASGTSVCLNWECSFDDIAFIQYTSGSTGNPKGVIVDHYNLVANCRACVEAGDFGPDDRSLSWLPTFHDMGLIGGLLFGIYMKVAVFVMTPRRFVLRPDSWLRAIHRYRITYTVAPNFAYRLVARRLPDTALDGLDLSSLRLAFDGAEPIDRNTVEAFCERFARCGFRRECFYPVYGLAECTLGVSFPVAGDGPAYDGVDRKELSTSGRAVPPNSNDERDAVHLVSVGRVIPGHRVRVLAPDTDEELEERQVGEVAIQGPSVTRGYWGKSPRQSTELRTGDLGYVANGQLYVVDRIKDLVITAGRNVVPSDIEQVIGNVSGVQKGSVAVFGVRGDQGTDELVVVAAIEPRAGLRQVRIALSRVVLEHFNLTPAHVCLVASGGVPKTSSGKVQRAECRRLFKSGTLRLALSMRPPARSSRPPTPSVTRSTDDVPGGTRPPPSGESA